MRPSLPALLAVLVACGADPQPPPASTAAPAVPTEEDAVEFNRLLDKADALAKTIDEADTLFNRDPNTPLSVDEKAQLMSIWAPLIDYLTVMDGVRTQFATKARGRGKADKPSRGGPRGGFDGGTPTDTADAGTSTDTADAGTAEITTTIDENAVGLVYAAHTASIWLGLQFVARVTGKEVFETVLDEVQPEVGLAAGLLSPIQNRVLDSDVFDHMKTGGRDKIRAALPGADVAAAEGESKFVTLARRAETYVTDAQKILDKRGTSLRLSNLWQNVEDSVFSAVLPVQTAVARWMGDTRIYRAGTALISESQLTALVATMRPGDIVVERRNWFVSNIGLPGFWPHAELFVGPREALEEFDTDAEVKAAYPDGFTTELSTKYPVAWAAHGTPTDTTSMPVVLEAISEGVVFSAADEAMLADYIGVLRPNLTQLEKARAIERAYARFGQPYDFDFDFLTDSTVVCSELVYKAYQAPSAEGRSLAAPLVTVAGRYTLPPGEFLRYYSANSTIVQPPLGFVGFLDGDETTQSAFLRGVAELVSTLVRPKWDWSQE